jgi:acyl-CoA synthetase (AMP-forming)/AMP-acid ligase II
MHALDVNRRHRAESPEALTLADLLRSQADAEPERVTFRYLPESGADPLTLCNAGLERRARAIAVVLRETGVRAGDRVLLVYPQGLDYIAAFFACAYVGAAAVPVVPPRPHRPLSRLEATAADARAAAALTTRGLLARLQSYLDQAPHLRGLRWLASDAISEDLGAAWRAQAVGPADLALVQYTSGSTAEPKGVMLSHANVLRNMAMLEECFAITPESRGVSWLPPYHDMGFMSATVLPLYCGCLATLLSPLAFLQHPVQWLRAVTQARATHSGGPNFAYELCARKVTEEQKAGLNLSSWQVAFVGAEPIRKETLDRFLTAFARCGFRGRSFCPCYGLAEATLLVTGCRAAARPAVQAVAADALEQHHVVPVSPEQAGARPLVGCGQPVQDGQVVIADPETGTACGPGGIGEIWIGGSNVAQGYWDRPAETAQTFRARLAGTGDGPFLRSGDLGFLSGGELFVTGRRKDLLIIRGCNHYPQDIELTVAKSHSALQPDGGAAFSIEVNGEERLVVVHELGRQHRLADHGEVQAAVRQAVAEQHDVQVYRVVLLKPGGVPRTSSGKIQRQACRAAFLAGTLEALELVH